MALTLVRYEAVVYKGVGYMFFHPAPVPACPVEEKAGRWFIRMGFAGFNSPSNNRMGYASEAKALAAIRRYENRSRGGN